MKQRLFAAAFIGLLFTLTGCSTPTPSSLPPQSEGSKGGVSERSDASALQPSATDRKIVTTGKITVTVDNPSDAADQAVSRTEQLDGHVDSRTESKETEERSRATLTLRVPSDSVSQLLEKLKQLGTVSSLSLEKNDVTSEVIDVNARINALQTSITRLLSLMSQATDAADLIALESSLSQRESELSSLVAQRDSVNDQIAYSTITLTLYSRNVTLVEQPNDFWSGLATGWKTLLSVGTGAIILLGVLLPWIIALIIPLVVVIVLVRVLKRRRKTTTPQPERTS